MLYTTKFLSEKLHILYILVETTSENIGSKTVRTILEFIAKSQFIFKVISLFKELEESCLVSLPLLLLPVLVAPKQGNDDKD